MAGRRGRLGRKKVIRVRVVIVVVINWAPSQGRTKSPSVIDTGPLARGRR